MARNRKALPITLAAISLSVPQIASACHNVAICFTWPAQIEDQDYGELLVVEKQIPAHGARVTLIRPPPEEPLNRLLDESGCMAFDTQFASGHTAILHAEAWIGTTTTWHFRALLHEGEPGQFTFEKEPRYLPAYVNGLAENDVKYVDTPPGEALAGAEIMAISTVIMKRFDDLGVLPPPVMNSTADFDMLYDPYRDNANGTCEGVLVGKDRQRNKNVMAHEFGHWLQCQWAAGAKADGIYDYGEGMVPPEAPCLFYPGAHALRSAEWSTSAMVEGFGHFIAAVVFNDHVAADAEGIFRYYKTSFPNDEYDDLKDDKYRVSLPGGTIPLGGVNRWTDNQCSMDWANEGVSSEIDWLRFFWYFLTNGSQDRPLLEDVLEILADTKSTEEDIPVLDKGNFWIKIHEVVDQNWSQFLTRLEDANTEMGVFNADAVP